MVTEGRKSESQGSQGSLAEEGMQAPTKGRMGRDEG